MAGETVEFEGVGFMILLALRAGLFYFVVVFSTGFALGIIRILCSSSKFQDTDILGWREPSFSHESVASQEVLLQIGLVGLD